MANAKPQGDDIGDRWNTALQGFITSTKQSMDYAWDCAMLSFEYFETHGDLSKAQIFFDAMPKNWVRRVAYYKWLSAHSPVLFNQDEGKLYKNKSAEAVAFNRDGAFKTKFWEFAPDPEQIYYGETDIVVALKRVARKFDGDRYLAKDDAAITKLAEAKRLIRNLEAANANGVEVPYVAGDMVPARTEPEGHMDDGAEVVATA